MAAVAILGAGDGTRECVVVSTAGCCATCFADDAATAVPVLGGRCLDDDDDDDDGSRRMGNDAWRVVHFGSMIRSPVMMIFDDRCAGTMMMFG